jgi:hypothetical protein
MKTDAELELRFRIAEAKLGVAEQLRIPIAGLAGVLAYSSWDSWFIALGIVVALFFLVPYGFSKEYDRASAEWEKATGTGKYYRPKDEPKQPPAGTP